MKIDEDGVLSCVTKDDIIDGTFIFPKEVKFIEMNVFQYCSKLTSITLPGNLIKIEPNTFLNCPELFLVGIEANSQEEYDRVSNLLPPNIKELVEQSYLFFQEKLQENYDKLQQKIVLLSASSGYEAGFFNRNLVPQDIINRFILDLASQYRVSPFMIDQIYKKIATEAGESPDLGNHPANG